MSKLHYQILALTILIGAPFLVSILTTAIPGMAPQVASMDAPAPERATLDYMGTAPDVMAGLPEPLAPPEPQEVPQGPDMTQGFSAEPTLDTSGISVDPVDNPGPDMAETPSQSAPPASMPRQDNMPPPEPEPDFREGQIPRR